MRHNHQIIRNMTRNQILKSIATAQKAIEKATKNVAMYTTRRDNAIAKANKKGYNLSVESFQVTERFVKTHHDGRGYTDYDCNCMDTTIPFDVVYPIESAWNYIIENKKNLERETTRLEQLNAELAAMDNEQSSVDSLVSVMEMAMYEFKNEWFGKMEEWHKMHHSYINEHADVARAKYNRIRTMLDVLERQYPIFSRRHQEKRQTIARLERWAKDFAQIIGDKACGITLADYMVIAKEEIAAEWTRCMAVLVKKLEAFNINIQAVKVNGIGVTKKGFECIITDGQERNIYARMIWAAEYSMFVSPHTRYIITERKL